LLPCPTHSSRANVGHAEKADTILHPSVRVLEEDWKVVNLTFWPRQEADVSELEACISVPSLPWFIHGGRPFEPVA